MLISLRAMRHASRLSVAVSAALVLPFPAFAETAPSKGGGAAFTDLDKVQVHGHRDAVEAERAQTPGNVNVVDGETFYARSVNNMADSLRYVPGVWAESGTGGDGIFLSSRGSNLDATDYDNNGVKVFQDGLPVTTADGNNHNRFPDPMAARRVVVAHGANALTYGASTLGGAIDFISRTARDSAPLEVFVNAGSFGLVSGRLTAGAVAGDLDGQLTVESKARDGYREHGRESRTGVYANGGWRVSDALDLRVFATHVDNDQQLAGALTRAQFDADPRQADPSAVTGNYQLNVVTSRLAAKGTWNIDADRRLEFGLSYEDQDLYHPIVDKIMVDIDGPGPMEPVEVFSLLMNTGQKTWAGMARYHLRAGDHDVLAGVNLADTRERGGHYRNDGGRRNGLRALVDNRSRSMELFLVDRWMFATDWTLVYGAQGVVTRRDVRNTDVASGALSHPKADYSSFNPRIGVIHALGRGNEAYASLSRLYEAPTTLEMQDDVRGGDATLDAMHGGVVEVGLRGSRPESTAHPAWHWDVAAYYARIRDEILSIDDPLAPGTSLSTNIDRTTHAGLEALVGASIPFAGGVHRIEPQVSATWNAFTFDGDAVYGDNDLPAAPRYVVRGEVLYRNDDGFFAGPTFDLVGARYADFSNTYRVRSYSLLGLRAGIERPRWELFGELRNLTDRTYVGTLGVRDVATEGDAILQAGAPRSVYAGLRLKF
ncbi:TonB-dependent receptor family protein [Stenotrophomonas mori]|uniref:TonB-dependent receptor n=1 Tax=Stenotrophomonas mori TaxID=2871096 RepID=A0ABT0SE28_9GAMM|nr:TonB-dependent receptor [Stenotrophomonas mori]MCL7713574.1 TonB-dependent receptor [Stenotrophomonas mori]